jgi:FtsP/CotA-like multicopper oxidase with cupredoxin domain
MPISRGIRTWIPHRPPSSSRMIQVLAVPVALAAVAGLTMGTMGASADSTPTIAAQEAGMAAGHHFQDPPDANSATGPNLTVTLTAADTRFDLSGKRVWGQSYNGDYVAPTLHMTPGQTATIVLVNHLSVATNLHFHGLHVSPTDHSDDSFLCVDPGKTLTYRLHLPTDHPQGTYWYHSHAMGTSCAGMSGMSMADMPNMDMSGGPTDTASASAFSPGDVENQIFAGLSGALIVGDDRTLLPPDLQHVTAHTMVLKDVQIDGTGHIVQNSGDTSIDSNAPTVRLVNGQLQPTLTMRPGETQLWRLINAGADIFYQLQLDGYRFTVIGEDGQPVARITTADTLLLPPAKRFDVLVTAGPHDGTTWLRTLAYSNGPQGDAYPRTNLLKLDVDGKAHTPLPAPTGAVPTASANLANATVAQHRTITLSEDSTGTQFYINGKQFSMDSSVFSTPAKLGTVEEWTIYNTAGEIHPFHVHTDAFQVMSVNGVAEQFTGRQDIIPIPNEVGGVPGKVVIRIPFTDFTGPVMFHCHIAAHEDNGMMSFINVVR